MGGKRRETLSMRWVERWRKLEMDVGTRAGVRSAVEVTGGLPVLQSCLPAGCSM